MTKFIESHYSHLIYLLLAFCLILSLIYSYLKILKFQVFYIKRSMLRINLKNRRARLANIYYKQSNRILILLIFIIFSIIILLLSSIKNSHDTSKHQDNQNHSTYSQEKQIKINPSIDANNQAEKENKYLNTLIILSSGSALIILLGALLVGISRSKEAKIIGAILAMSGVYFNFYIVKDLEIENLLKFENHVTITKSENNKQIPKNAEFGPQLLGGIENFDSGSAEIKSHMMMSLTAICESWKNHGDQAQQGLLLIVGSTDRTRLNTETSAQYESNNGLARARSEQVKDHLYSCGLPLHQMLTLTSGPKFTPKKPEVLDDKQASKDRSVTVWALWSVPTSSSTEGW